MATLTLLWILIAASVAAVFYFLLLPRFRTTQQSGMVLRAVVFFLLIGFLAYDFYTKEKFGYIGILALGSIAFVVMLRMQKKKD